MTSRTHFRLLLPLCALATGLTAQPPPTPAALTPIERQLLTRLQRLQQRVTALESKLAAVHTAPAAAVPAAAASAPPPASASTPPPVPPPAAPLETAPGVMLGLYFDGYFGWNFNRPVGRVNLLRANDVLSDSLSLNQLTLVLDRPPVLAAGRRYGLRADLMFGQNTESMQGGPQNEPRPQVYRNLFQAYGTYVVPVGSGLTVDFGKFASSLGLESNYGFKDANYSRSYLFGALPFYHMGIRTTYVVNSVLTLQYWLVNGINQTEDFNGFKSNALLVALTPSSSFSWNVNYFAGAESRGLAPAYSPGLPMLPTQPGLSTTPVPGPPANGLTRIFDTYATWTAAPALTLAGEVDHIVSRTYGAGPAVTLLGGAAYAAYRFTPKFSIAARAESLRDNGGFFSGITQRLAEGTLTAAYQPRPGFAFRAEFRRDWSNQPFFLTAVPGVLARAQSTATLGLLWWYSPDSVVW